MGSDQPTRMDYQQLRQVVLDLGHWAPEDSSGPRPRVANGFGKPFDGLYLKRVALPCKLHDAASLFAEPPAQARPRHMGLPT